MTKPTAPTVGDLLSTTAGAGHNNPPEPTPFEAISTEINDLYLEAGHWLDGEPIANEGQAAEIGELLTRIQAAAKRAEELRVVEKKPHDDAAKAVQERYNPLIHKAKGKAARAVDAAKKALAPWLAELDRRQRAEAEKARKAQQEAEERARAASRAAAESASLAAREEAERLQEQAKAAAKTTRQAETAKAQVHATGGGRAIGMKTVYTAVLVDPAAAIAHYRALPYGAAALKECMTQLAQADVRSNPLGHIPGFRVDSSVVPA